MGEQDERAGRVLRRIGEIWQIEGKRVRWASPNERDGLGFDWWPGDFRVRIRARPFAEAPPGSAFKVTVRTDFLKDVALDTRHFEGFAAMMSKFSAAYAWIYPPVSLRGQAGKPVTITAVWLQSSCYIAPDNVDWMPDLLAEAGVIQAIHSQIQAFGFPDVLRTGAPDIGPGPRRLESEFDGILDVTREVYVPDGEKPSRWAGAGEFEQFAEKWGVDEFWVPWAEAASLILIASFGADRALIKLDTEARHPQLGHGLLALIELPLGGDDLSLARAAAELNYLEATSWTGFPQLGCWYVEVRGEDAKSLTYALAFALFIPNASYRPGLVPHVAFWLLQRLRWAREQQFPGIEDKPILEILEKAGRFRK